MEIKKRPTGLTVPSTEMNGHQFLSKFSHSSFFYSSSIFFQIEKQFLPVFFLFASLRCFCLPFDLLKTTFIKKNIHYIFSLFPFSFFKRIKRETKRRVTF